VPREFTGPGGTTFAIFEPEPVSDAPAFSDEALALRFADRHARALRYVSAWERWLYWTGTHWQIDRTLHAFDLVRALCREAAAECNSEKLARALASAKTVGAVERLAKADRRLVATTDQWDLDPWLLNTPEGTIDLRTGRTRQHHSGDYLTKATTWRP
jgi:putative DNA primase/helicase